MAGASGGVKKTLDRILSRAGLGSRSDACKWIGAGRVAVNGRVVRSPEHWVQVGRDRVTFDGRPLTERKKLYVLLYKPKGYISSYGDPGGRPTVYDLVADLESWVAPVGRLDQDTTGLLILTNDNEFANFITAPDSHVPKTYLVKTASLLDDTALERLRGGIELADGAARPARVERLRDSSSSTFLEITLTEGRNRQVRRMIEAAGSHVRKLVRTAIGPLRIGELEIGKWRLLTAAEVAALKRAGSRRK